MRSARATTCPWAAPAPTRWATRWWRCSGCGPASCGRSTPSARIPAVRWPTGSSTPRRSSARCTTTSSRSRTARAATATTPCARTRCVRRAARSSSTRSGRRNERTRLSVGLTYPTPRSLSGNGRWPGSRAGAAWSGGALEAPPGGAVVDPDELLVARALDVVVRDGRAAGALLQSDRLVAAAREVVVGERHVLDVLECDRLGRGMALEVVAGDRPVRALAHPVARAVAVVVVRALGHQALAELRARALVVQDLDVRAGRLGVRGVGLHAVRVGSAAAALVRPDVVRVVVLDGDVVAEEAHRVDVVAADVDRRDVVVLHRDVVARHVDAVVLRAAGDEALDHDVLAPGGDAGDHGRALA